MLGYDSKLKINEMHCHMLGYDSKLKINEHVNY